MNVDCITWRGLAQGVKMASRVSAFAEVDKIEAEIEQLAHGTLADPRRVEAMRRDCPKLLQEVEARTQKPPTPQASNLLADLTALARGLRELGGEEFAAIEEVVTGERARRDANSAK